MKSARECEFNNLRSCDIFTAKLGFWPSFLVSQKFLLSKWILFILERLCHSSSSNKRSYEQLTASFNPLFRVNITTVQRRSFKLVSLRYLFCVYKILENAVKECRSVLEPSSRTGTRKKGNPQLRIRISYCRPNVKLPHIPIILVFSTVSSLL